MKRITKDTTIAEFTKLGAKWIVNDRKRNMVRIILLDKIAAGLYAARCAQDYIFIRTANGAGGFIARANHLLTTIQKGKFTIR